MGKEELRNRIKDGKVPGWRFDKIQKPEAG